MYVCDDGVCVGGTTGCVGTPGTELEWKEAPQRVGRDAERKAGLESRPGCKPHLGTSYTICEKKKKKGGTFVERSLRGSNELI